MRLPGGAIKGVDGSAPAGAGAGVRANGRLRAGESAIARVIAPRERRISSGTVVLAVAVLGSFMAFVDATIVNIAVPAIARGFHARLSSVSWVLNAYNIVFAAFLVGGGQLADLLGRRRVFVFSLLLFTLASALCAVAPSLGLLVAARLVQAAGAAMLVPSSLAIVLHAHRARERMHAVAMWAAVAAVAAGTGPPLGGVLITASSWRLVFLVNIPVGIVAAVLAGRVLVESRAPGRRRVPDLLGGLLLALAIAAFVLGVVKGQEWGWTSARVIGAFAGAALLLGWFVLRSGRQRTPVVDPALFRIRAFALSNGVTLVMASGFYAYTLCNVLFLTTVWRYSILQAGLALVPGPVVAMLVARPASALVERVGHRAVAVPGALVWAAGMAYFITTLGTSPDFAGQWLPGMIILGTGAGLSFPTLSGAAVGSVPGPRFAIATALNSVARQIGAALGVAVLIAIVGNPGSLQALHAFRHGWQFAAGCFVAGALASLALVVPRTAEEDDGALPAPSGRRRVGIDAARDAAWGQLPRLADAAEEHAQASSQTVVEFLRNVQVFAALPAPVLQRVAALASSVRVPCGEWLFRQGDDADAVYLVRLGHLEVLHETGGRAERINTVTRGAVMGELALLNDSERSASVRALRDSELLRIDKPSFDLLLREVPELPLSLTRVLSAQLQASRAVPVVRRARPVTIALRSLDPRVDALELADELSRALCAYGRVAVLSADRRPDPETARTEAAALFSPLVERCEADHDQVLLVCGGESCREWDEFCIARADRVLFAVSAAGGAEREQDQLPAMRRAGTRGSEPRPGDGDADGATATATAASEGELVAFDVEPGSGALAPWVARLAPAGVHAISRTRRREDVERMARRLCGRAVGVVLAGGGARAFAHLGVLEVLADAGFVPDRVAGVSMGSFIGALLASGHDSAAIDACCYEEWVRRNPINDYTLPRTSLIRGRKAEAMLERVFGEVRVEELPRPFYCASVNLRGNRLVIVREGEMMRAVGASLSMPLIAPPLREGDALLIDGSLLDNLPVEPMSSTGEGPVLAIDIKGVTGTRAEPDAPARHRVARRIPSLPETMARVALLSSANTDEAARRYADFTIGVRVPGVGLLEFHQIDQSRAAGRVAARAALEEAPPWLTGDGARAQSLAGRRTVIRVRGASV